jgi:CRP/FNR family cyclic AMP-dependent transcriptional regulator
MVTPADLAQMALFAEFSHEDLAIVAASLVPGTYSRGELIFRQGDPGTNLWVIEQGRVKIRLLSPDGRHLSLDPVPP